jgi:hypothetical protein
MSTVYFVFSNNPSLVEEFEASVFNDRLTWESKGVLDCVLSDAADGGVKSMNVCVKVSVQRILPMNMRVFSESCRSSNIQIVFPTSLCSCNHKVEYELDKSNEL